VGWARRAWCCGAPRPTVRLHCRMPPVAAASLLSFSLSAFFHPSRPVSPALALTGRRGHAAVHAAARRFVEGRFAPHGASTIGASFVSRLQVCAPVRARCECTAHDAASLAAHHLGCRVTCVTCRVQMVKKLTIGNAKLTMQVCGHSHSHPKRSACAYAHARLHLKLRCVAIPTRSACIARGQSRAGEGYGGNMHDH
jgi:hypothetical protein